MAKPGLRYGERVGRRFDPIPPQEDLLGVSDLPTSITPEYFIRRMREIEAEVEDTLSRRLGDQYKYDPFKMHLGALEPYEREAYQTEISQLLGAQHFLNNLNQGPTMIRDYFTPEGWDERSPAGVFAMTPEAIAADPRAAYLSQSTFRFFKLRAKESAAENYLPAATLPRIETILTNQERLADFISGHGKTLVFDVESPSLNPEEGIWQLSAQLVDERGNEAPVRSFYFDNPALKRSLIRDPSSGEMVSLHKFLVEGRHGDFERNMREFFKMAGEAQTVAGHNVLFDYNMLATTLRKSDPYKKGTKIDEEGRTVYEDFAKEAETFLAKFYNRDTRAVGNVIDTSVLARMVLPHIGLAEELEGGPSPYRFSLPNLLLQTNLSQYFSQDELERAIGRGLHYADVDVPFETKLLTSLRMHLSGELPIELGNQFLTGELRRKVANARALGPNIAMEAQEYYHPSFWGVAGPLNTDLGGPGGLSPMEQLSIRSRNLSLRAKALSGTSDQDIISRISTQDRLIGALSKNRRLISQDYQYLSSSADISDTQEWYKIQQELADRGIPLPGLSLVERHVTSMLSSIGGPGMGSTEATMREIAGPDMLGLGRFIGAEQARVVGDSRIAVLPLKYLQGWEAEMRAGGHEALATHFLEGNQMLGMSAFTWKPHSSPEAPPIKEVGLSVRLSQEQRETLADYLSRQEEFQTEEGDALLTQLIRAFENTSGTYGVQIGTLGGIAGHDKSATRLYDLLKYYQGVGADYSDQTPMFQTAFATLGNEFGTGDNNIYTAGAFLRGDLLGEEEQRSLTSQITRMVTGYQGTALKQRSPILIQQLRGLMKDPRAQQEAIHSLQMQMRIFKAAPYAAAGVVAAAGGYYAYKRHEQNKQIDATFNQMPAEPQGWSRQNFYQAVPYNPRRNPHSYLDTANVVSSLDNNKINHTNMNQQQKYSYLFTGGGYST